MEEANNNEKEKVNKNSFRTVQNPTNYSSMTSNEKTHKARIGFGRGFLLPFVSGVLGCAVVIGTCFSIEPIRNQLLGTGNNSSTSNSNNSNNTGLVSQVSLSNYSDTAVYAANKILPSIVGITVEYNVSSLISMFGNQVQTSSATATG